MSQAAPFFSILLPTFNRASTLPLAIKSVLNQTYTDFELVISNGGSTDDTDEAVSRFDDSRVRYFTSPHRLSMPENYEKSISVARGKYIIFFSDDDAFVPSMLARLHDLLTNKVQIPKMVVFPFAQYYPEGDIDLRFKLDTLTVPKFSSTTEFVKSSDDLKRMSGRFGLSNYQDDSTMPRPLIGNVVLLRSVVEELRKRVNSIFATVPVDGYFITLVLCSIDEYIVYDQPLLVWSKWAQNASTSKSVNLSQHYLRLLDGRKLEQVPLTFALPMNCAANSILQASEDVGSREDIPVEWDWYFRSMHEYLINLRAEGVDVENELCEFEKVRRNFNMGVSSVGSHRPFGAGRSSRQNLKLLFPSAFRLVKTISQKFWAPVVMGDVHEYNRSGARDVLEAAKYLETLLPEM